MQNCHACPETSHTVTVRTKTQSGAVEDRESLRRLRSVVFRDAGGELVELVRREGWPTFLQLVGDGLLKALDQRVEGGPELARECVGALRERGWRGDQELAQSLTAALGDGPTPMLRPLPVSLDDLAEVLEGDPAHGGGRVDLQTGEVWPRAVLEAGLEEEDEDEDDGDEDPDRFLWVDSEGSRDGYRDMALFIGDLDDERYADLLARAIAGGGAFRRFRATLEERPELIPEWQAFSEDRRRGRARSWLADQGYRPARRTSGP